MKIQILIILLTSKLSWSKVNVPEFSRFGLCCIDHSSPTIQRLSRIRAGSLNGETQSSGEDSEDENEKIGTAQQSSSTVNPQTMKIPLKAEHNVAKRTSPPTIFHYPELQQYAWEISDRMSVEERSLLEKVEGLPHVEQACDPTAGKFLQWLCTTIGATKAIEVGVFRGTTTLALALALPEDGKVVALDISLAYIEEAEAPAAWEAAGVLDKIDFRCGPAIEALDSMIEAGEEGTYDFAFIDADKASYEAYYERCLRLLRVGGIIAIDNVFLFGTVFDTNHPDGAAIHSLNLKIKSDDRVAITTLTITDGMTLARKL